MSELRVEKTPVAAEILQADGTQLKGNLFLAPFSRSHQGPQTVADLMLEAGQVLPFKRADGGFLLLGTRTVAAVCLTSEDDGGEYLDRVPVRLRLVGGHALEGEFLAERGAGDRLSNVLDSPAPWFRVEQAGTWCWISKRHLLTLEPLSP